MAIANKSRIIKRGCSSRKRENYERDARTKCKNKSSFSLILTVINYKGEREISHPFLYGIKNLLPLF
jgi:hypothetical protein